jgi:uncharacterized protein YjiS (DUF1127 family)
MWRIIKRSEPLLVIDGALLRDTGISRTDMGHGIAQAVALHPRPSLEQAAHGSSNSGQAGLTRYQIMRAFGRPPLLTKRHYSRITPRAQGG